MKALLLAAGRGVRMGSMTEALPKPMVPVSGRPILERIISGLAEAGVQEFVLIVGYRAETIESHFGDGSRFGIRIDYRRQTALEGTARAVLLGREAVGDSTFFLSWGDILVDPRNYLSMRTAFETGEADAILAVNRMDDPYRGSSVVFGEDGVVRRIIEKPPKGTAPSLFNGSGIFCFQPELFEFAERVPLSARGEYELPEAFQAMIEAGRRIRTHEVFGYWGDVGTPEDWERMNQLLARGDEPIEP